MKLILPMLCFIPLSVWILSWLTWCYTKEEIKITLFAGTMTITRMYDGKKCKKLAETKIKDIKMLEPYSANKFEALKTNNVIYAVENNITNEAYVLVWDNTTAIIEINEKTMKIIKYYTSSLFE